MKVWKAALKCGCRRYTCFKCGKAVGLALERACFRHSRVGSFTLTNCDTVSWCEKCARQPSWPPPHANWPKAPAGG